MGVHKKRNAFVIDSEKQIVIGKATNTGAEFFFNFEDYEKVKNISWYESSNGYIMHKDKDSPIIQLHRFITDCPRDKVVDHKNHNPKDNRRQNLRICTQKENVYNRTIKCRGRLNEFGITTLSRNGNLYYIVRIGGGHKGCFKNLEAAKKRRDEIYNETYKNYL